MTHRCAITFLGAARTVTGSMHLLEAGEHSVLVDCGMYQGRRQEALAKNRTIPAAARDAEALLLTHAHIDHSGNLPTLVKRGFAGAIHCTTATADLCQHMLLDAARIQESDTAWLNRKNEDNPDWVPLEPLYTEEDAQRALKHLAPHPYGEEFAPVPGLRSRFIDAGHVLGSASIELQLAIGGKDRRLVFSGDIGRRHLPLLRDPSLPDHPDLVVMESTYGNRMHAPAEDMKAQLLEVIEQTRARGGKIVIPSFALERAQEIVFALKQLVEAGRLAPIPVYLDSPLAVNLTEVFRRHRECYDAETLAYVEGHGDPFGFNLLSMVESTDASKELNSLSTPAVIISASGMCESGRIVHHLRNSIEGPHNTIVIVGYQAPHTLGRRLVERRPTVKIFGVEREVRAEVRVLNAFSAHADRDELLWWAEGCGEQVSRFFVVHGDPDQCDALARHLTQRGRKAIVPSPAERIFLDEAVDTR
jgi:metallo-beta-lactamase family protein